MSIMEYHEEALLDDQEAGTQCQNEMLTNSVYFLIGMLMAKDEKCTDIHEYTKYIEDKLDEKYDGWRDYEEVK